MSENNKENVSVISNINYIERISGLNLSQDHYNLGKQEFQDLLDTVIKVVAKDCMQSIVRNVEQGISGEKAWWTIRETYDIPINDQKEMLPNNRMTPPQIEARFYAACTQGNVQKIQEFLEQGARIIDKNDNKFVSTCRSNVPQAINTLKFFLDNEHVTHQPVKEYMMEAFETAYLYNNYGILEFFIVEKDFDSSSEFKNFKKNNALYDNCNESRDYVEKIIECKKFNQKLENDLSQSSNYKMKKI